MNKFENWTNEELCILAQEGNKEAKDYLVERNVKLIEMFTKQFTNKNSALDYDDIYSEAAVGFLKAINGFDPTKGCKFSTYAGRYMSGNIMLYLRNSADGKCFRVGREQKIAYGKKNIIEDKLAQKLGRTPTLEEVAQEMNMTVSELSYLITINKEHSFLQEVIYDNGKTHDSEITIDDSLEDDKCLTDDEILRNTILEDAIAKLNPKRQFIIRKLYFEGYTQREVADMLGTAQCLVSRDKRIAIKILYNILKDELEVPNAWHKYKPDEEQNIMVKCVNTGELFDSIRKAEKKYNIYRGGISRVVNKKQSSAGKHPETGEPLVWEKVIM